MEVDRAGGEDRGGGDAEWPVGGPAWGIEEGIDLEEQRKVTVALTSCGPPLTHSPVDSYKYIELSAVVGHPGLCDTAC